ncbi:MAG: 3'-5' exonuclease [Candidatus Hydrogenedentota bacterium]
MEDILLRDAHYVVVDIETTGYRPANDEILEIAAVHWHKGQELEHFQSLIKPENKIPEDSISIHNITDEMVKDAPGLEDVLIRFLQFIKNKILVFHNAQFDKKFINYNLQRLGMSLLDDNVVDTLKISRRLYPRISHALTDLSERLRLDHANKHRAYADAYCTAQLLDILINDLEREEYYFVSEVIKFKKKKKDLLEIFLPQIEEAIKKNSFIEIEYRLLKIIVVRRIIKPLEIIFEDKEKILKYIYKGKVKSLNLNKLVFICQI